MPYELKYNIIGVNLNNIEVAKLEDSRTNKCSPIIDLQTRLVFPNNCKNVHSDTMYSLSRYFMDFIIP